MISSRRRIALAALTLSALPLGLTAPGCTSGPAGEEREGAVGEARQALSTCVTFQRGTLGAVRDATIASTISYPGWGATWCSGPAARSSRSSPSTSARCRPA
jgi:hypothetical protein